MRFTSALAYVEMFATLAWVAGGAVICHIDRWGPHTLLHWSWIATFNLAICFGLLFSGVLV